MKIFSYPVTLALICVLASGYAIADPSLKESDFENKWFPFHLSIYSPAQLINEKKDIKGLRLNLLLSNNANVYGIDLGLGQWLQKFSGHSNCRTN